MVVIHWIAAHWIDVVLALVFAIIVDSLRIGSAIGNFARGVRNKFSEVSAARLRKRIMQLETTRAMYSAYLTSDKGLYLMVFRMVLAALLSISSSGALLIISHLPMFSRLNAKIPGQLELFALWILVIGMAAAASGIKVTSLDTRDKVAETVSKIEKNIAELRSKLEKKP